MAALPYLNLGCGYHYHADWVNVDFSETGKDVIGHNLLKGIPFNDNTFKVVYHSHVLEHFPKTEAVKFIEECYRVLKPDGIIRIAIPDLEQIVANYTRLLNMGKNDMNNIAIREDYDWILTEMYDQVARDESGGEMLKYLSKERLNNEEFIFSRIGHEGRMLRKNLTENNLSDVTVKKSIGEKLSRKLKDITYPDNYKKLFLKLLFPKEFELIKLARFKKSGEIHQWMYDIYSLGNLLRDVGFNNVRQMQYNESSIPDWTSFGLDEVDNAVRKPDSLFVEAIK